MSQSSNGVFSVQGISLSTYSIAGYADSTVSSFEADAKTSGANYVALGNVAYVDLNSAVISDAYDGSLDQTAPLADVAAALSSATSQGLSVLLKPQLVTHDAAFSQYTSGSWINLVDPNLTISDPDQFFASYKAYILKWAAVAEQGHAAALSIGNEMVAATKPEYTHYWDDIIAAVRQVYHGELTYSALLPLVTNSSTNEVTQIGFWDKLDFAGFDVYPSLAKSADPSVSSLDQAWHQLTVDGNSQDYYSFVSGLAQDVGKPVVFTETGVPSFAGASDRETSSDGSIGSSTTDGGTPDQAEQADWWQSFFQTWAVNKPSWLSGVFVYNNDPEQLGSYGEQNYNVIGKTAAGVISSWFDGKTVLAPGSDHLTGSQADDQLYAYGPAAGATLAATQETTVAITVTSGIVDGTVPTIDVIINGVDYGAIALKANDSGYVASDGTHWTTNQTFTFSLAGLQQVNNIQVGFVGPPIVDGHSSTTFFQGVSVNGTALQSATYTSASGYVQSQLLPDSSQGGSTSQWNGGSTSFDTSTWNVALSNNHVGSTSDPIIVDGQAGYNTLHLLGPEMDYSVSAQSDGAFLIAESSGLDQNVLATNIQGLVFGDGNTFDLSTIHDTATHLLKLATPADGASSGGDAGMSQLGTQFAASPDELLWIGAGGEVDLHLLSGATTVGIARVGAVDPNYWEVAGSSFNSADGLTGILWRGAGGETDLYTLDGSSVTADYHLGTASGNYWTVAGFTRTSTQNAYEILWTGAAGEVDIYNVTNGVLQSDNRLGIVDSKYWSVVGFADATGGGSPDILWRGAAGEVDLYTVDGGTVTADQRIGYAGTDWSVAGFATSSQVGKAEILWVNKNGNVSIWAINGSQVVSTSLVEQVDTSYWHVSGFYDVNGDGQPDIVWGGKAGEVSIHTISDLNVSQVTQVGSSPTAYWHLQG